MHCSHMCRMSPPRLRDRYFENQIVLICSDNFHDTRTADVVPDMIKTRSQISANVHTHFVRPNGAMKYMDLLRPLLLFLQLCLPLIIVFTVSDNRTSPSTTLSQNHNFV